MQIAKGEEESVPVLMISMHGIYNQNGVEDFAVFWTMSVDILVCKDQIAPLQRW